MLSTQAHDFCKWGSPIFLYVVHQPASPSIWSAVQSLRVPDLATLFNIYIADIPPPRALVKGITYAIEWRHCTVHTCFVPCYPQFELEIHIVEVSYFTNILIQVIWSLVVNSILQITPTFIFFFLTFVILKLHILFGYCVDDNGVSFPCLTNQEPLFSFVHGRSSHLSLHIIAPPGILYTWIRMYIVCFIGFDCFQL